MSIFSCSPKTTDLLSNVQMKQTLVVTNQKHDAAEMKDLTTWHENRAGLGSLIFITSLYLCLREFQDLLGESRHNVTRKEKRTLLPNFPICSHFGRKMKGQISKPGQPLRACNLWEDVNGINCGGT